MCRKIDLASRLAHVINDFCTALIMQYRYGKKQDRRLNYYSVLYDKTSCLMSRSILQPSYSRRIDKRKLFVYASLRPVPYFPTTACWLNCPKDFAKVPSLSLKDTAPQGLSSRIHITRTRYLPRDTHTHTLRDAVGIRINKRA